MGKRIDDLFLDTENPDISLFDDPTENEWDPEFEDEDFEDMDDDENEDFWAEMSEDDENEVYDLSDEDTKDIETE